MLTAGPEHFAAHLRPWKRVLRPVERHVKRRAAVCKPVPGAREFQRMEGGRRGNRQERSNGPAGAHPRPFPCVVPYVMRFFRNLNIFLGTTGNYELSACVLDGLEAGLEAGWEADLEADLEAGLLLPLGPSPEFPSIDARIIATFFFCPSNLRSFSLSSFDSCFFRTSASFLRPGSLPLGSLS